MAVLIIVIIILFTIILFTTIICSQLYSRTTEVDGLVVARSSSSPMKTLRMDGWMARGWTRQEQQQVVDGIAAEAASSSAVFGLDSRGLCFYL